MFGLVMVMGHLQTEDRGYFVIAEKVDLLIKLDALLDCRDLREHGQFKELAFA